MLELDIRGVSFFHQLSVNSDNCMLLTGNSLARVMDKIDQWTECYATCSIGTFDDPLTEYRWC